MEAKIRKGIVSKDQVYQDYYALQRTTERTQEEFGMRIEQI